MAAHIGSLAVSSMSRFCGPNSSGLWDVATCQIPSTQLGSARLARWTRSGISQISSHGAAHPTPDSTDSTQQQKLSSRRASKPQLSRSLPCSKQPRTPANEVCYICPILFYAELRSFADVLLPCFSIVACVRAISNWPASLPSWILYCAGRCAGISTTRTRHTPGSAQRRPGRGHRLHRGESVGPGSVLNSI